MKNYYKKNEIQLDGGKHAFFDKNGKIIGRNGITQFCGKCCKAEGLKPSNSNKKDIEKAEELGFVFYINNDHTAIVCAKCGREVAIEKTYDTVQAEIEEKNLEKLENLHLVLAGEDWECGFKFYALSANIEYEDWLKVKKYFKYYKSGWSEDQELEFDCFEPTGWLTRNPTAVEQILVNEGLIKSENTLQKIAERAAIEKQKIDKEKKKELEKREEIKNKIGVINEKIKKIFDSSQKRELSDAEAYKYYFRAQFGQGDIANYTVTEDEIIHCVYMGDFIYGIAIPYSKECEELLKEKYKLNDEY